MVLNTRNIRKPLPPFAGLLPLQRYDIQRFNKPEDLDKFIITTDEAMGEEGAL